MMMIKTPHKSVGWEMADYCLPISLFWMLVMAREASVWGHMSQNHIEVTV